MDPKTKQRPPSGQGLVEYAIILVLAVVAVLVILQVLGVSVRDVFCTVTGGLGGGACKAQTVCSDSFSSLGSWSGGGTGWSVNNGMLCNTTNNEQRLYNNCSQGAAMPKNYSVKVDIAQLLSGNGYGIMVRQTSTNPTTGYAFQYDPGLSGFVIRKWVNGMEVNPALAYAPANNYNWFNTSRSVRVDVQGSSIKAYVDGVLVLSAVDSTYTTGGVGLRTWDSTRACFDNFSITEIR